MHTPVDLSKENRFLGPLAGTLITGGLVVGLLGFAASIVLAFFVSGGFERFAWSYLLNFTYFLSFGLGALFWVLIQHVTRAAWSVVLRRLLEGLASSLVLMAVLVVPVVLMADWVFAWADAEVVAHDAIIRSKEPYLNLPFFVVRVALYVAFWVGASLYLLRASVAQDADGEPRRTLRLERNSGWLILLFAITTTFAAFDFLMSLDAHWFSTIFGVYYFAGAALGSLAVLALMIYGLQRSGRLELAIQVEHYHDVGKLIFAFVVFWAYIAFSQYMLIWYANLPEETGWYLRRQQEPWLWASLILLFGHFLIPFLALMSRVPKRRKPLVALAGAYLLVVHWIDIYWLVMPEYGAHGHGAHGHGGAAHGAALSPLDLTLLVGFGGLFVAAVAYHLRRCSLIAERDPRLVESLTFENA
jgi:hypothetical protein